MAADLEALTRNFAAELSDLLNGTVTNGVRVSSLKAANGRTIMGAGIKQSHADPSPIAVSPSGKRALVYLHLFHSFELDPEGTNLATSESNMSLYTSQHVDDDTLIVGIHYDRNPNNQYPGGHLHVAGRRDDLDAIYLGTGRKKRKLRDFHLPVGGRRFRPTLEDLIEFMVTEEMVVPRPRWREVLDEHRDRWTRIQVKAAARRYQHEAAGALKEAGWTLTPPDPDQDK